MNKKKIAGNLLFFAATIAFVWAASSGLLDSKEDVASARKAAEVLTDIERVFPGSPVGDVILYQHGGIVGAARHFKTDQSLAGVSEELVTRLKADGANVSSVQLDADTTRMCLKGHQVLLEKVTEGNGEYYLAVMTDESSWHPMGCR